MLKKNAMLLAPTGTEGGGRATPPDIRGNERTAQINRCKQINETAEKMVGMFPDGKETFRNLAVKAISEGTGVNDFNIQCMDAIPGIRKAQTSLIGMSEKDIKRYSLLRACQNAITNKGILKDGFEYDLSQSAIAAMGSGERNQVEGFVIPADVIVGVGRNDPLFRRAMQRDLNVTSSTQGGNFIATNVVTPIIEILRNKMVTQRLGIQVLSGLQGNIAIPRQTGAATAYTLAEQATLTKSTQVVNQVSLTPKRVGAYNSYSKQLLLQSSVDVENFVRDDLMKVLAIKIDSLVLEGPGGSAPLGIKGTTGIGAVTFGGADTWAKVIEFETALALANADLGNMAYVADPATRGKWKGAAKATNFPLYLWEKGSWGDGSNDGEVNSYRAACTNQISNNMVAFGNWEDDILAMWGGYDVVIDPYTTATSGTVNVIINTFIDNAVRHAASFAWSTDSGAQ